MSKRLEQLLEKESQLKAQIQQARALERTKEKKKDTRRKILIGSAIMAQVEAGDFPQQELTSLMDSFLTRPNERELFGLSTSEASRPKQEFPKATSIAKKKPTAKKTRTREKAKPKSQ